MKKLNIIVRTYGKYALLFLFVLLFASYLLKDSETLGSVKQQVRPQSYEGLVAGSVLEQEFVCADDTVEGIELFLQEAHYSETSAVRVGLYRGDTLLQEWNVDRTTISRGDTTFFQLDEIVKDCQGENFRVTAESAAVTGIAVGMAQNEQGVSLMAYRVISHEVSKGLVLGIIALISAVGFVLFMLLRQMRVRPELLFAGLYLLFAVYSMVAVPVFNTPDEGSHFVRSYEISRGYMLSDKLDDRDDIFSTGREFAGNLLPVHGSGTTISFWDVKDALGKELDPQHPQFWALGGAALYAPTSYLPQAVGIRLADIFTDRPVILAYAGRIANMLLVGLIFFFSIRWTPVGKNLIAMLGLLPINLQSVNSLSADGFAFAIATALLAFVLYMRYGQKKCMNKKQFALMYILTGLLCLCKVVYVPICLFLFLIPKERFRNEKKYRMHILLAGAMIVVLTLGWLLLASGYLGETQPGVNTAEQLKYILTNPSGYIHTFIRTLDAYGVNYLLGIFGNNMGWGNIPVCDILVLCYGIFLILQVALDNDIAGFDFGGGVRLTLGLIGFGICFLVFITLYGQWTAYGSGRIEGVQGRYFLPLLFPILLALKPRGNRVVQAGPVPWNSYLGIVTINLCVFATMFVRVLCDIV